VIEYLEWFDRYPVSNIAAASEETSNNEEQQMSLVKIEWNKQGDEKKALTIIVRLAKILAHLRGTLQTWETKDTQGTEYDYSLPIIEEPDRAITQLRNLARGHALSQGRNHITVSDIPILIKVVLSTASIERVKVFDLLIKSDGGRLSTSQITQALDVSNSTAKRTMVEFKGIGIVSFSQDGEYDNSEKIIMLKHKFKWFLTEEFKQLRQGFTPDVVSNPSKEDQSQTTLMLQEKTPLSTTPKKDDTIFECYYCEEFSPTDDKPAYNKHVILEHPGRLAYPSDVDLKKMGIKPKGKKWEN
jgi:predicted transcriptional regulator